MNVVEKNKIFYGKNYNDYNLVFCQDNGDPISPTLLSRQFKKWQKRNGLDLPLIDIHGLRHSSASYVYKFTKGDLSAVASHTRHLTERMALLYSHIDEDQRVLTARKMGNFYDTLPHGVSSEIPLETKICMDDLEKNDPALAALLSDYLAQKEVLRPERTERYSLHDLGDVVKCCKKITALFQRQLFLAYSVVAEYAISFLVL